MSRSKFETGAEYEGGRHMVEGGVYVLAVPLGEREETGVVDWKPLVGKRNV
jgi:hypothetical protein